MDQRSRSQLNTLRRCLALALIAVPFFIPMGPHDGTKVAIAQDDLVRRRNNVPYWDWEAESDYPAHAIFWFGQVGLQSNYIDIRTIYYNEHLEIVAHVVDRNLYQSEPTPNVDLSEWDAISIWLNTDGNGGDSPNSDAYRFIVQLGQWELPEFSQRAFRGNGSGWSPAEVDFSATASWRGTNDPNSGEDAKGWSASIIIPFESLGLAGPPESTTNWGFAVTLHDRDSQEQSAQPTVWPEMMDENEPSSWGQLEFGRSEASAPDAYQGEQTIRHGVDGVAVHDAHVGGHTTCGDGIDHWTEWGNANYAAYDQINIQNQWDISDYPCFSKYFITIPLDRLPRDIVLVSAELTLYLFGNAGYEAGQAEPSAIQALTVGEEWDESTITWNNAPLAIENVALTWVDPVDFFDPAIPYTWHVTDAAVEAYVNGEPLRLAFYSADGEYHSGKYFWSSDAEEAVRPFLHVKWRESTQPNPSHPPAVNSHRYFPQMFD